MADPLRYIVFGTQDPSYVAIKGDDNTFTGNNTFSGNTTTADLTAQDITATSITLGGTALTSYVEGTFTPTVTLVGGAGNTVPVYASNIGRYTRIGRMVFVSVYLFGDGGDEGAGTGTLHIALPITASANQPNMYYSQYSYALNGSDEYQLSLSVVGSATTVICNKWDSAGVNSVFLGNNQNNTQRAMTLNFYYEA